MWWLFDQTILKESNSIRFFQKPNGRWTARQLNYRGRYDAIKKPMFWDLGGPILAFDEPFHLRARTGYIRLLSRAEFLAHAQLAPLTIEESQAISHYVVTREDEDSVHGEPVLKLKLEDAEEYAATFTPFTPCTITTYRLDGSIESTLRHSSTTAFPTASGQLSPR